MEQSKINISEENSEVVTLEMSIGDLTLLSDMLEIAMITTHDKLSFLTTFNILKNKIQDAEHKARCNLNGGDTE